VKDSPHQSVLNRSVMLGSFSPQDDTTLKCWGFNGAGNLGLGDHSNRGDDANGSCPPSSTTASLVPPPRVLTLARMLSASRDGDEPPFGRPGAWEDGRSRHRWEEPYVRSAGKLNLRLKDLLELVTRVKKKKGSLLVRLPVGDWEAGTSHTHTHTLSLSLSLFPASLFLSLSLTLTLCLCRRGNSDPSP